MDSLDKQLINDILQKYMKNIYSSHYCCSEVYSFFI